MAADLMDRDPVAVAAGQGLSVRRQVRVLRVFAARNRSATWAYLSGVGWRRITSPTGSGARDLLSALCRARLAGTEITAEITGTAVVAVSSDDDGEDGEAQGDDA
jgi:hypothetical protein